MSIAVIAGNGDLPKLLAQQLTKDNKKFIIILVKNQTLASDYKKYQNYIIEIGHIGKALEILNTNKIKNIVFAGGVAKPSFKTLKVDNQGALLLSKIMANKIFGDDNILTSITKFFAKRGFKVIAINKILKDIVSKKGCLTVKKPSKSDLENIKIGQNSLKIMSKLDIGQSIVVQQKQIIAVEAIEGTDEMIKRSAKLKFKNKEQPVLIKIKKKQQNKKIDLPTIGIKTIEGLLKSGFSGLAIKSDSTLIIDKEQVVKLANQNNLFIQVL